MGQSGQTQQPTASPRRQAWVWVVLLVVLGTTLMALAYFFVMRVVVPYVEPPAPCSCGLVLMPFMRERFRFALHPKVRALWPSPDQFVAREHVADRPTS